jgi:hypothetical protein
MAPEATDNQVPPAGSVFSLGWLMAQLYGPLQRRPAGENLSHLPALAELDESDGIKLALVELARLLAPYPDLSGAPLANAWGSGDQTAFTAAVSALNLAILECLIFDSEQLNAYQLGRALSDTCWLPENADAKFFLGQFERHRLATLQLWLAQASGVLPPLSAVTVSRSLQNWQDWADTYASMITSGWATLRAPISAAVRTQAAAWHALLGGQTDTDSQTSVDAWIQAGRSMVRTGRQLTAEVLRRFWPIVVIIAVATGGLLYLAIANSSGTAKVWTSLVTVAAALGVSGASLRAAALRAASGIEQDIWRAANFDARAWGATWLPTEPHGRAQQRQLANRGVDAPHARNALEVSASSRQPAPGPPPLTTPPQPVAAQPVAAQPVAAQPVAAQPVPPGPPPASAGAPAGLG